MVFVGGSLRRHAALGVAYVIWCATVVPPPPVAGFPLAALRPRVPAAPRAALRPAGDALGWRPPALAATTAPAASETATEAGTTTEEDPELAGIEFPQPLTFRESLSRALTEHEPRRSLSPIQNPARLTQRPRSSGGMGF